MTIMENVRFFARLLCVQFLDIAIDLNRAWAKVRGGKR